MQAEYPGGSMRIIAQSTQDLEITLGASQQRQSVLNVHAAHS